MDRVLQNSALHNRYFTDVVLKMMFVHGDAEHPSDEAAGMVLDIVKHQLIQILEKSSRLVSGKRKTISLKEIIYHFRHHPHMLARLMTFAKTASTVRSLSKDVQPAGPVIKESDSEESGEEEEDGSIVSVAARRFGSGSLLDHLEAVIEEFFPDRDCTIEENKFDSVMETRKVRMAVRVQALNGEQYERFTEARKASFYCPLKKNAKGKESRQSKLSAWLGCSIMGPHVEFVLGFLARETVALFVEDALTVREQETSNWFKNEGATACIQLRHYEEALRRNLGLRYCGDFLFGYS